MNEEVLVTSGSGFRHQPEWNFPLKTNEGGGVTLEPRNMTGGHARKCVKGLKSLATVIFHPSLDESSKNPQHTRTKNSNLLYKWHYMADAFEQLMEAMDRKEDFTDDQIDDFHVLCNTFFDLYVDIFKGEGITNYLHIIGSGHLVYYLLKYRNLYKFCQQGWEALNQLLKQFYFNNTNHGGCQGNSKSAMVVGEHCKPLIRLCQRRIMWLLGLGQQFFEGTAVVEEDS